MNIKEFLATENGARLVNGNRWLVINASEDPLIPCKFVVYEHKYHARYITILIETTDEALAVAKLVG